TAPSRAMASAKLSARSRAAHASPNNWRPPASPMQYSLMIAFHSFVPCGPSWSGGEMMEAVGLTRVGGGRSMVLAMNFSLVFLPQNSTPNLFLIALVCERHCGRGPRLAPEKPDLPQLRCPQRRKTHRRPRERLP